MMRSRFIGQRHGRERTTRI